MIKLDDISSALDAARQVTGFAPTEMDNLNKALDAIHAAAAAQAGTFELLSVIDAQVGTAKSAELRRIFYKKRCNSCTKDDGWKHTAN